MFACHHDQHAWESAPAADARCRRCCADDDGAASSSKSASCVSSCDGGMKCWPACAGLMIITTGGAASEAQVQHGGGVQAKQQDKRLAEVRRSRT